MPREWSEAQQSLFIEIRRRLDGGEVEKDALARIAKFESTHPPLRLNWGILDPRIQVLLNGCAPRTPVKEKYILDISPTLLRSLTDLELGYIADFVNQISDIHALQTLTIMKREETLCPMFPIF